jgi:predicted anti-sigma-YlaC factor YlaD
MERTTPGTTCATIREAISAELDGEASPTPHRAVTEHVAQCAACRSFALAAGDLQTVTARAAQMAAPVGTARTVTNALDERGARLATMPVRLGLVAVAAAQLVLAVPGLIFGSDEGAPIHVAHEAGAWSLALAVGFLFAAWRPLRAVGMLPFVGALSAGLVLTAAIDLLHGRALAVDESVHLLAVAGTGLLWLLAHPRARRELIPV